MTPMACAAPPGSALASAHACGLALIGDAEPASQNLSPSNSPRVGDRLLDVGCGPGASLIPATAVVGTAGSVTGIDLAPGMVTATAAELDRLGLSQASVRIGDAAAPDFPDGSFDAVLAGLVLFFLPDPVAAARKYAQLLRPGGRLAVSTFQEMREQEQAGRQRIAAALGPYMTQGAPPPMLGPPPDARLRTRQAVAEVLTTAGFVDIEYASLPTASTPPATRSPSNSSRCATKQARSPSRYCFESPPRPDPEEDACSSFASLVSIRGDPSCHAYGRNRPWTRPVSKLPHWPHARLGRHRPVPHRPDYHPHPRRRNRHPTRDAATSPVLIDNGEVRNSASAVDA